MRSVPFTTLRVGAGLFALCGMVIWAAWSWREALSGFEEQGVGNARLISLYTERLVQTQIILQQATLRDLKVAPQGHISSKDFRNFLTAIGSAQEASAGLAVYSTGGQLLAASETFPEGFRFPHESFRAARAAGTRIYIGRHQTADPLNDLLFVAIPLDEAGAGGIFVSMLTLNSMRRFLIQIAPAPGEAASLLRSDGLLILRRDVMKPVVLDPNSPARLAIAEADHGAFRSVAVTDGIDRLYTYTRVGQLPLYANYGVPVASVRKDWLVRVIPVWLFLGSLAVFTFVLTGRMRRALQKDIEALATRQELEATQKIAEQRAQLMQELSHRVKNNLALVLALIDRQVRRLGQVHAQDLKGRIQAIAEVHSMLFAAGGRFELDFGGLIDRLGKSPALIPPERRITVDSRIEPGICLGPDSAVPLALVAAELLTNAVKYAFPDGRPGCIRVALERVGTDEARLTIADDGVGMSKEAETRSSGLQIVAALVQQAEATLERTAGTGTSYEVTFPIRGHVPLPISAGQDRRTVGAG
ncbi:sensor histidine kinase [Cereibacter sphaeroides]|uniref:sensor histidine kinase n=1 Tax=Cereibacter sphaeroides TaxID=1063 RepID=UPI001F36265C|nr:histidine kinase dimerization/phosphoacceptor domain -containing protein [Cereibacter sphaeroides]MCE6951369.1 sensor histidine kinase [Cereibacter sphaeroides]